ncbi:methyltransferase family protein [Roseiarcus fermentans]|uniref:Methyltransferase family protein n=1 Tax=Roseiarcus fermentans TaxID=1473586 RepID=A0A366FT06_9HYPH|nr:class I SAM-dependent methyltransferase [Roseiarcus fermentans]RBP17758.1 methyltransferase family protein [Roseiarcus fermentans]
MTAPHAASLDLTLAGRPSARALAGIALAAWPEHEKFLLRSFGQRSPAVLDASETVSAAILKLIAGEEARFGEDYRWTCDRLREEEIFFHREGRYRLSTFAEAHAEVYSNDVYMGRYMRGLLLTQALWFNHAATTEMFLARVLGAMEGPFDYLEVGPGHGLMTAFAAASPLCRSLEAWDVSATSLEETRAALKKLGAAKPVALVRTDILRAEPAQRRFDLVVISEVLEHLEAPGEALRFLRSALSERGRIFVNVPINSPSPDHLALFSSREDVVALVEGAGYRIDRIELYATQGRPVETALAQKISVSAAVVGRPE